MPGTAASLGVTNPLDPPSRSRAARSTSRSRSTRSAATRTDALAAYNAGPGAVQRYGGVPPYAETQSYVSKVLGYAEAFRQSHGGCSRSRQRSLEASRDPPEATRVAATRLLATHLRRSPAGGATGRAALP